MLFVSVIARDVHTRPCEIINTGLALDVTIFYVISNQVNPYDVMFYFE